MFLNKSEYFEYTEPNIILLAAKGLLVLKCLWDSRVRSIFCFGCRAVEVDQAAGMNGVGRAPAAVPALPRHKKCGGWAWDNAVSPWHLSPLLSTQSGCSRRLQVAMCACRISSSCCFSFSSTWTLNLSWVLSHSNFLNSYNKEKHIGNIIFAIHDSGFITAS